MPISEDDAQLIYQINRLILQYRAGLTGNRRVRAEHPPILRGFAPRRLEPPRPARVPIIYVGNQLDIVHVNGQIYGFICAPGTGDEDFIFFNGRGQGDDELVARVEQWHREAGIATTTSWGDRRYQGAMARITEENIRLAADPAARRNSHFYLSLEAILGNLENLFIARRFFPVERATNTFYTLLLVVSETAKNPLIHQQLISHLVRQAEERGRVVMGDVAGFQRLAQAQLDQGRALASTVITAGQRCREGQLRYLDEQGVVLGEIIEGLGRGEGRDGFARKFGIGDPPGDDLVLYQAAIGSSTYLRCLRTLQFHALEPEEQGVLAAIVGEEEGEVRRLPGPLVGSDAEILISWLRALPRGLRDEVIADITARLPLPVPAADAEEEVEEQAGLGMRI